MPKYAELVYNGFWFSPEREAMQQLIDRTQKYVTGTVRVKLYKVGGVRKGTLTGQGQLQVRCQNCSPCWLSSAHHGQHKHKLQGL